jgi:hypothetical protein
MLQVRKERKKERNFILQFSHKFHFAALIFWLVQNTNYSD